MFYIRLSIKTACFVDKVAKIGLLSIKMPFFWTDREFGIIILKNNGYAESKEQCGDKEQEGLV